MNKLLPLALLIIIIASGFVAPAAWAATFRSGDRVNVDNIQDDLYAAGGTVLVSGNIKGNLFATGGTVTVDGSISNNAYVAGGTVVVRSVIGGDMFIGGGDVQVSNSTIEGDVYIGGGSVTLNSPVNGKVRIGGGNIYLNAPVAGNVEVDGGKLTLGSKALLSGTLTYRTPREATMEPGSKVLGKVTYEFRDYGKYKNALTMIALVRFLMLFISSLVLGLFFRRYFVEVTKGVAHSPWAELGRGFASAALLPIGSIILLITIVGVPLGILGLMACIGLIVFSIISAAIILGSVLLKWLSKNPEFKINWKTILLGSFVFSLLTFIPIAGWAIQGILVLMALGWIVHKSWQSIKQWR